ncbi:unnamed protein product [Bursaphelenchus okinawaensis]|uniref:Uncharacterized protein n=1 Tax=Bursaphelenchus okinawaensis TaxID=465554 RepID=A0A811K4H4_9BILA|nr:unnamed protein product [Bursaphelenchus okinawaensis]CAG9090540.1 unnamed protein product [Bursaphelenchus okinawaensis]
MSRTPGTSRASKGNKNRRKSRTVTESSQSLDVNAKTPGVRRRGSSAKLEDDGTQMENQKSHAKSKVGSVQKTVGGDSEYYHKALHDFVMEAVKVGPVKLAADFTATRLAMPKNLPKTAFLANPTKNRYKDVFCLDQSIVKLTWPADDPNDYIHANYVPIEDQKKYICTQGPTEKTVIDFWRIIWQEKCKGILMLTEVMEQGKKKCEQYWPTKLGEEAEYGPVKVKVLKILTPEDHLHCTRLEVSAEDSTLTVEHMLWKNWPDRGVPKEYLSCFRMIRKMTQYVPVVVHCSAGIGRTGTIVGLEMMDNKLRKGEVCPLSDIVAELRTHRHGSVQTMFQFLYMHRTLMELAVNKRVVAKDELKDFYEKYEVIINKQGAS